MVLLMMTTVTSHISFFTVCGVPVSAGVMPLCVYAVDVDLVSRLMYQVEYCDSARIIWVKTLDGRNHFNLFTSVSDGYFNNGDITVAPLRG